MSSTRWVLCGNSWFHGVIPCVMVRISSLRHMFRFVGGPWGNCLPSHRWQGSVPCFFFSPPYSSSPSLSTFSNSAQRKYQKDPYIMLAWVKTKHSLLSFCKCRLLFDKDESKLPLERSFDEHCAVFSALRWDGENVFWWSDSEASPSSHHLLASQPSLSPFGAWQLTIIAS